MDDVEAEMTLREVPMAEDGRRLATNGDEKSLQLLRDLVVLLLH